MDAHQEKLRRVAGFDRILITSACEKELRNIYNKGSEEQNGYEKWLDGKLEVLETSQLSDLLEYKRTFEDLGKYVFISRTKFKLYSIRRQHHEGNPRVIFTYLFDESGDAYILLVAFREIQGSDYSKAMNKARKRLMDLFENS